jgi:hypothetical protein
MAEHESRSLLHACDGETGESEDSPRLDARLLATWYSMPGRPRRMHQVAAICVALVACWAAVSMVSRQHGARLARTAPAGGVGELMQLQEKDAGQQCHTAIPGEECYQNIVWHSTDIEDHPEWYAGLTKDSSLYEWQTWAHEQAKETCARPCPPEEDVAGTRPVQLGEVEPDEPPGHDASKTKVHRGSKHKANRTLKKDGPKKRAQKASTRRRAEDAAEDAAEAPPASTTERLDEPEASGSDDATGDDCAEIEVWKGKCHTSTPGESCFSSVDWALKVGLPSHPDWYSDIEADATFEDVQGFLHDHHFQLSCCPPPCEPGASEAAPDAAEGTPTDAESEEGDGDGGRADCRSVAEGDPCYEAVDWAMTVGILQHPEWYEGEGVNLTGDSTFEEFQEFLHDERQTETMCPAPCRSSTTSSKTSKDATTRASTSVASSTTSSTTSRSPSSTSGISSTTSGSSSRNSRSSSTTAISDTGSGCKTSVEGDDCHKSVVWAMDHGIKKHADWYPGLSGDSTFEEFQKVLHDKFPAMSRCSLPCSSSAEPAEAQALGERPAEVPEAEPRSIQDSQVIVAVEEEMNKSALALASGGIIKGIIKDKAKNWSAAAATPAIRDAGAAEAPDDSEALAIEAAYEDDMTSMARLAAAAASAASAGGNRSKARTGAAGIMAAV